MSGELAANDHYLSHVASLANKTSLVASEDIYDEGGMKLWAKGQAITPELQERLARRKLKQPIERCITAADGVSSAEIKQEAAKIVADSPAAACVVGTQAARACDMLRALDLSAVAQLLLTTSRENGAGLLRHSLLVAVLSYGIGARMRMGDDDLERLLVSGLFHDIGMLYLPQHLLNPTGPLSQPDWKLMASHPRVGELAVRELTLYPASVARAILEHHERADGSGYPQRIAAEQTSKLGQVLQLAEALAGILEREASITSALTALNIVHGEYAPLAVRAITASSDCARNKAAPAVARTEPQTALKTLRDAMMVIDRVMTFVDNIKPLNRSFSEREREVMDKVRARMLKLQRAFIATGVTELVDGHMHIVEHAEEHHYEIEIVAYEAKYRARECCREIALLFEQIGYTDAAEQVYGFKEALN